MLGKLRTGAIWAMFALASIGVTQADAGGRCQYFSGYGAYLPPNVYVREHIPYFALHPPVYYSYPVARTYGYSPFAYPPGTMTPEITKPEPVVISNRFVPTKTTSGGNRDRVARQPLRSTNPYVTSDEGPGAAENDVAASTR